METSITSLTADPLHSVADADSQITKLIVAVHGIGDQYRFATIQAVARQVATICGKPTPFPLGRFHPPQAEVRALLFDAPGTPFDRVGFAEVFWADIHQKAQRTQDTIEESKAWAATMVERMKELDRGTNADRGFVVTSKDSVNYEKTGAVLREMIETIETLDNLCFLAEKAGLFKFSLRDLLDDYLGAVQLVAEFEDYGEQIFERFAKIMRDLLERHKNVEDVYIIAHSEGTVVTFHGLLSALSLPGGLNEKWVKKVRGYMTIGSPIDKHIVMWPQLWEAFHEQNGRPWEQVGVKLEKVKDETTGSETRRPIVWWNYYDKGDPVGFELDSAREWLIDHKWVKSAPDKDGKPIPAPRNEQPFFDFPEQQDIGFSRYLLPGQAHNDYWTDEGVFSHFFGQFFPAHPTKPSAPTTKYVHQIICWLLPYFICFFLLMGATYILYTASKPFLGTKDTPLNVFKSVLGIACLLAGITVTSRIPRLTKIGPWYLLPIGVFSVGILAYHFLVEPAVKVNLAESFPWGDSDPAGWPVIWIALGIAVASAIVSRFRPKCGMKPLIFLSGCAVAFIVHHITQGEEAPLWPLVLAAAAFLYLWWLTALLFDLVFVWHRYIRSNATTEILKELRHKRRSREARLTPPANPISE